MGSPGHVRDEGDYPVNDRKTGTKGDGHSSNAMTMRTLISTGGWKAIQYLTRRTADWLWKTGRITGDEDQHDDAAYQVQVQFVKSFRGRRRNRAPRACCYRRPRRAAGTRSAAPGSSPGSQDKY